MTRKRAERAIMVGQMTLTALRKSAWLKIMHIKKNSRYLGEEVY